ncbi:hypothetical protein AABM34_17030 [Lysinibacillus fusiformis]
MDSLKMLEQYKNVGDRVDEVLFHTVAKELGRLREIIDQKNFSINLIGEQKLDTQKENKRLREALEDIASTGYTHLEMLKIARKALEEGEIK